MRLQDVMQRQVEILSPEDSVRQIAEKMRALDVGALPVCDGGRIVGMVTDRDIVVRAVCRGDDLDKTRARDVMTNDLVWAFEDESVDEVARKMRDRQVRRIPVVNRDKALVGIVSLGDLATRTGDVTVTSRTLEKISQPAKPNAAGNAHA